MKRQYDSYALLKLRSGEEYINRVPSWYDTFAASISSFTSFVFAMTIFFVAATVVKNAILRRLI